MPTRLRQPLQAPAGLNQIWALDFMSDALYGGRKFRTLNVIDLGNREALAIEVSTSIPSVRVVRASTSWSRSMASRTRFAWTTRPS